jgi:hypothetical protein
VRRLVPLLPSEPVTRLVTASTLVSAAALAWAFWPQGQPVPVDEPVLPGLAVPSPAPVVGAAAAPAAAGLGTRPTAPVPSPAAPGTVMTLQADEEPEETPITADAAGPAGPADQTAGETLYLTIVGDQTFVRRGAVGERADPVAGWSGIQPGSQTLAAVLSGTDPLPVAEPAWTADPAGTAGLPATARNTAPVPGGNARGRLDTGQPGSNDPDAGGFPPDNEEPLVDNRPWPQPGCPWTLGPEAGQSMADQLRDLYGCRYLSSCQMQTGMCTWHYQGST